MPLNAIRPMRRISAGQDSPREAGLHPTQKPLALMEALIEADNAKWQLVLDPFAGSRHHRAVAAKALGRCYLMFERSRKFYETAQTTFRAIGRSYYMVKKST